MNNKMVLNIMIAYFVILSVVLVYQLTKTNNSNTSAPSSDDAVLAEERLNNATVFYNNSTVILKNKAQTLIDKNNPNYTAIVENGKAYLPTTFFNTAYGANVSSDLSSCTATIRLNNKALVVGTEENTIIDNSNEKELDAQTKPIKYQHSVYVPADAYAEAFGLELYIYGNMGVLGHDEFTSEDNSYLDSLVCQVNDLPYVSTEDNLKSVANVDVSEDIFESFENKFKRFEDKQDVASVNYLKADNSPTLIKNNGYLYYGGTGEVEILSSGDTVEKAAEIQLPETFVTKKLMMQSGKLIVFGNNSNDTTVEDSKSVSSETTQETSASSENDTKSESGGYQGNVSTVMYIYDVSNLSDIKPVRTYSVSGYYQNAVISGDYIYLLSQNSVYGLFDKSNFNAPSYFDSSNGVETIGFDKIQYFPEIGDDDITIVSAIDFADASKKVNIRAFLGAGDKTYISENHLYITKDRNTAFESYTSVENSAIYRYSFSNGSIDLAGKTLVKGNLIDSTAISEDNGYLRIVTKFTDPDVNNKKVSNVYVLNNNLEICGQANKVSNEDDISSVIFSDNMVLLAPLDSTKNTYIIDITNPTLPKGKGIMKVTNGSLAYYTYDETTIITLDNGDGTLKLKMIDITDSDNPVILFSQELGRNDVITTPLFHDSEGFLFDKEKNVMVVPVNNKGAATLETLYVYSVFKDEGLTRIGTIDATDCNADCISKGKLITFDDEKALVSPLDDIKKQQVVEFHPVENTETTTAA